MLSIPYPKIPYTNYWVSNKKFSQNLQLGGSAQRCLSLFYTPFTPSTAPISPFSLPLCSISFPNPFCHLHPHQICTRRIRMEQKDSHWGRRDPSLANYTVFGSVHSYGKRQNKTTNTDCWFWQGIKTSENRLSSMWIWGLFVCFVYLSHW